ncbi:tRNA-dihydrouridine synthase, partial [Bacillus sp. SIMBA_161]
MKENFWRELPKPFFVLAPMEDVTNVVFRHVVAEAASPDVYFTEFTNTESYCHPEGIHSVRG